MKNVNAIRIYLIYLFIELFQWVEEIKKHVREKSLRVFVYKGVAKQGYIQPHNLSCYDIVITSYETLRREVNYVDLPHSNSEDGRR